MTQMPNLNDRRPRAIDRILNSRGATSPSETQEGGNNAFIDSGGPPQMSFSIERASGEIDGFHYYNLDNIKFTPTKSGDHISFDHRGKVVVISGAQLRPVFIALMRHTLISLCATAVTDQLQITRIEITQT